MSLSFEKHRAQQRKEKKKRDDLERESDIISSRKRGIMVKQEQDDQLIQLKKSKQSYRDKKNRILAEANSLQRISLQRQDLDREREDRARDIQNQGMYVQFLERRTQDQYIGADEREEARSQLKAALNHYHELMTNSHTHQPIGLPDIPQNIGHASRNSSPKDSGTNSSGDSSI